MDDLKERCRIVMLEHLKTKGYPNLTRTQIVMETQNLWRALDGAGLIQEIKEAGHTYASFCDAAVRKAQEAAFDDFVADMADQTPRKKRSSK